MAVSAFDAFPKTLDELKERTLGGAVFSIVAGCLILVLFLSELGRVLRVETVDKLDVDVTHDGSIAINVDIYFPSLACNDFVVDVVDETGVQQLHVAEALSKMRVDRHGVPIDVPEKVDWGHTVAPGFRFRKVNSMLDSLAARFKETVADIEADEALERAHGDALSHDEHAHHRSRLAHQARTLQQHLDRLSSVADPEVAQDILQLSRREAASIRDHISAAQLYSEEHMGEVTGHLDSVERHLEELASTSVGDDARGPLQEASMLRLKALREHLSGFVSAADAARRDKYQGVVDLVAQLANTTHVADLSQEEQLTLMDRVEAIEQTLDELLVGLQGAARAEAEQRLLTHLAVMQDTWTGGADPPPDYCGSCYGAALTAEECCNTCDDVRNAYRRRRWGMPDVRELEQCRREARRRAAHVADGEGCNLFGTMHVSRALGNFHIAPVTSAQHSATGMPLQDLQSLTYNDVRNFNASHRINRLSFGDDFPGQQNPLDGAGRASAHGPSVSRYFIKVVPTVYEHLHGPPTRSNQFSVTEYSREVREEDRVFHIPGVFFVYDLAPIRVTFTEQRGQTFLHFLTRCAATIGGMYTVIGMVDKLFYSSSKLVMKKLAIGKAS